MTPKQFVKARKAAGLSQTQLAKVLKLSVRHVSGMECGNRNITAKMAVRMTGLPKPLAVTRGDV